VVSGFKPAEQTTAEDRTLARNPAGLRGFSSFLGPAMAALLWRSCRWKPQFVSFPAAHFRPDRFFGLMPAAALGRGPFYAVGSEQQRLGPGLAAVWTFLLIIAVLAGLCFWPASRLRWDARGYSDFAVLGVGWERGWRRAMGFMQSAGFGIPRGCHGGLCPKCRACCRPDGFRGRLAPALDHGFARGT